MASKEAPGDLSLVRAFVNTLDLESGVDDLGTADACQAWLRRNGLLEDQSVDADGCARLSAVREALRELLLANNDGHTPDPRAVSLLREAAGEATLAVAVGDDGSVDLRPVTTGAQGAVARLLAIVYEASASGEWSRLKACRNDSCRWAFYDQSRNRSGHWCSMAVCGNRNKVKTYRRRRAAGA